MVSLLPYKARHRNPLGEMTPQLRSAHSEAVGKAMYGGFSKQFMYTTIYIRQDLPLGPSDINFQGQIRLRHLPIWGRGTNISCACGGEEGTEESTLERGCWNWRRAARKQRHRMVLAQNWPTLLKSRPRRGLQLHTDTEEDNRKWRRGKIWWRWFLRSAAARK
jgi:hypothetical protein